jgi:hypothetical protein
MPNTENTGNLNDAEVFNSSEEFYDALDEKTSGDDSDLFTQKVTQPNKGDSVQATRQSNQVGSNATSMWDSEDNPYKKKVEELDKRYRDSSRASVENATTLKELEPFLPVLNAMKQDSGLVQHVREYLVGGGKPPKTVQEELNLSEDFVYDGHEAMTDPNSDSAKVYEASVDKMVQNRVGNILQREKQAAHIANERARRYKEATDFQKTKGLNDDEMAELLEFANNTPITLDHYYIAKNMNQRDANIAKATKTDMLNQMRNTQNLPTSASGANSQGGAVSDDDMTFARLFGSDLENDNLFG